MNTITASQAWAILKRHGRDEIATLRLEDLCHDKERVSSLVVVHNSATPVSGEGGNHNGMILIDLSRQRMTLETLNHLLRLSVTRGIRQRQSSRRRGSILSTSHVPYQHYQHPNNNNHPNNNSSSSASSRHGNTSKHANNNNNHHAKQQQQQQHNPTKPQHNQADIFPDVMPSMHLALRAPKDQGLHMLTYDGVNALTGIHREWDRLERLCNSIRRGAWRGVTGHMIRNVVVIGKGVAIQALQFVQAALLQDETAIMASRFGLDNSSSAMAAATKDWSGRLLQVRRSAGTTSTTNTPHANVRPRKMVFLTSVDPLAAASLVAELDAASTMVISFALQGNEETGLATATLKSWLLQQLAPKKVDSVLSKHMLLITGNDQIATTINKPESVFLIPEHSRCEAFTSFSAATLLPLSIVYGWSICEHFLTGAHDMDCHFVETNPRHNLPVLLALTDVWNDTFFGAASSGRIVTPFTRSMNGFPAFVAALEAQACSSNNHHTNNQLSSHLATNPRPACSSLVLDGGSDSAYDRALYQSSKIQYSELVMVMNTQLKANTARNLGAQGMEDVFAHADALVCSLFGHADEMAFGGGAKEDSWNNNDNNGAASTTGSEAYANQPVLPKHYFQQQEHLLRQQQQNNSHNQQQPLSSQGNRPSTLLICGKLDAYACGQLIALSEHRAAIKARIWDIDPFTREAGHSLKLSRTEQLREDLQQIFVAQEMGVESDSDEEGENTGGLNLSTKTILGHYARVRS
ncbi:Glucose-6-phosphate isomerase, cytosolic [Seminavis robusta]|uniref:Glucose-6-phosphate isomerase, cytosolic n=1 Tax=Seminavis robusta TaxID=568900 RepID=A0A9N8EHR2_9STRA|nr:Glucose-6-phosphate isomerase, cytosolic [Seminavis robusta]|eukprot:Sro1186_g250400.1 Glucose-6-phosphate isomerase, cytosolic (749) ;mRNA; r:29102-31551